MKVKNLKSPNTEINMYIFMCIYHIIWCTLCLLRQAGGKNQSIRIRSNCWKTNRNRHLLCGRIYRRSSHWPGCYSCYDCGRICRRYQGILFLGSMSEDWLYLNNSNPDSENQANQVLVGGVCITVILNLDNLL